jgi:hypothetical protein
MPCKLVEFEEFTGADDLTHPHRTTQTTGKTG